MWNPYSNKSAAALWCAGRQRPAGGLNTRLTTPLRSRAFFALALCHAKEGILMPVSRSEVEQSLHRLANYIECELMAVAQMLLAESRPSNARDLVYAGGSFITELREIRDAQHEGGEE